MSLLSATVLHSLPCQFPGSSPSFDVQISAKTVAPLPPSLFTCFPVSSLHVRRSSSEAQHLCYGCNYGIYASPVVRLLLQYISCGFGGICFHGRLMTSSTKDTWSRLPKFICVYYSKLRLIIEHDLMEHNWTLDCDYQNYYVYITGNFIVLTIEHDLYDVYNWTWFVWCI